MNIQQSVVQREIEAIINSGSKPVVCRWDIQIHANGKVIVPLVVMNVECESNFILNYADLLSIEVGLLEGDLNYDIIPHKAALEVTIRRIPLTDAVMPVVDDYSGVETFRYSATLYDNQSGILEGNAPNLHDQQTANRGSYLPVKLQLVDPVIEQLRMQTVGGIFRNMTALDLVIYLLTKYSVTGIRESGVKVKGVTVLSQSTGIVRKHIAIPHLTPVMSVPDIVHQQHGGIFAGGFHYYLRRQQWYIYAPYDIKAYARSKRSLTLITVPANRFPSPERSYRETPTQLFVMATGDSKHIDLSEQAQLNEGNGVRFIDADKVFEDWGKVDNNRLIVTRGDNVNEIISESRPNKLNYVKESKQRITTNYMREYGELARRSGSFIHHVWENANPDLLYPGMPVKLMYLQNNSAEEIYGILVGVHAFNTAETKGMANRRFITNATLTVFINRHLTTT